MKYTRSESCEVVEVKGCTTCPHKQNHFAEGGSFMVCVAPTARPDGEYKPRKKKLTSHWEGAYHASCPLASEAKNVPVMAKEVGK